MKFNFERYIGIDPRSPEAIRARFIIGASAIGILAGGIFGVVNYLSGESANAYAEFIFSILMFVNLLALFVHKRVRLSSMVVLSALGLLLCALVMTGGIGGTGIFWAVNFPVASYLLLGRSGGILSTISLVLAFALLATLDQMGVIVIFYNYVYIRQMALNLLTLMTILFIYESILQRVIAVLERQDSELDQANARLREQLVVQTSNEQRLQELVSRTKEDQDKLTQTQRAITNVLEDLQVEKDEMQRLTERNNAVIASMGDGLIVTTEYGLIERINKQLSKLLDKRENELIGKHISKAFEFYTEKGELVTAQENIISDALATGQAIQTRYLTKRAGAIDKTLAMTASPFVVNERPAGVVLALRDVSAEAAIERSKTEFVSLASHQLRTPLSTIEWYIEMILAGEAGKFSDEMKDFLNEIYRASKRMVNLVNALLNVSRVDLGTLKIDPEEFSIPEVTEEVLADYRALIEKKELKIKQSFAKELPKIIIDKKIITVVLQNLLSNAFKYTPAKGSIEVGARKLGRTFVISVKDNGMGIPEKQHDKIFSKLFRADNAVATDTDGNGLGLYLVKSIVEQIGGNIGFKSVEGQGTTFSVSLPDKITAKEGEGKSLSKME